MKITSHLVTPALALCALVFGSSAYAAGTAQPTEGAETGLAAVYSDRLHGRETASGERYAVVSPVTAWSKARCPAG